MGLNRRCKYSNYINYKLEYIVHFMYYCKFVSVLGLVFPRLRNTVHESGLHPGTLADVQS